MHHSGQHSEQEPRDSKHIGPGEGCDYEDESEGEGKRGLHL